MNPGAALFAGAGLRLLAPVLVVTAFAAAAQAAPEIVSRAKWGARPARVEMMQPQTPREIIIHHTAMPQQPKLSLERKLRQLQSFSQSTGVVNDRPKAAWGDIPYHFYVDAAGRIGEGRDVRYAGDSNTGYSTVDRIQIVVEGSFDKEEPGAAQIDALDRLLVWLAAKYGVAAEAISGHGDHVATECPGQHLKVRLPALIEKVKAARAVQRPAGP